MFLGMRPVDNNSAHLKPLKNGEGPSRVIPCQTATGGVESMDRERIDLDDSKNLTGVISWMVLGDGNLTSLRGRHKNSLLQIVHKEDCEDYIRMKQAVLSKVTGVTVRRYWHSRSSAYFWQLTTQCLPLFTDLREALYLNNRKVITPHSVKILNEMALAILYQDDGRYNEAHSVLSINKPTFSIPELELLAKGIVDKFGIIFRVHRSCTLKDGSIGYELGLRMKDVDKFFDLISPYIVPSMRYKTRIGGSFSSSEAGEVLRTLQ